jgi:hypothetical protein
MVLDHARSLPNNGILEILTVELKILQSMMTMPNHSAMSGKPTISMKVE